VNRKKRTIRFVIDASVIGASGSSDHPTSSACRELLVAIRRICHRVALSDAVREEWNKHQSQYSMVWRASMVSLRKIDEVQPVEANDLREAIENRFAREGERKEAEKDVRLIEAAMCADKIVVSLDNRARHVFEALMRDAGFLRSIRWIQPVDDSERLIAWMEGTATSARHWKLGN
jgi:hypothetical protein